MSEKGKEIFSGKRLKRIEAFAHCCFQNQDPRRYLHASLVLTFPAGSGQSSHDVAAPGFVLAECRGEQLCLAGEVQESLGEAAVGAGLVGRLELVHACQSRSTEDAVDALLGREGRALQVRFSSQLLGQG